MPYMALCSFLRGATLRDLTGPGARGARSPSAARPANGGGPFWNAGHQDPRRKRGESRTILARGVAHPAVRANEEAEGPNGGLKATRMGGKGQYIM